MKLPSLHTFEISTGDRFNERGFATFLAKLEARSPSAKNLQKVTLSRKANSTVIEFVGKTGLKVPVEKLHFLEH